MGLNLLYRKDSIRQRRPKQRVFHECEKSDGEFDTNHGLKSHNHVCEKTEGVYVPFG